MESKFNYRLAELKDTDKLLEILSSAKQFMKDNNLYQWSDSYPTKDTFLSDIENEIGYVILQDNRVIGYFALIFGIDPLYSNIIEGKFLNSTNYAVIHRIMLASEVRGKKLSYLMFKFSEKISKENGYRNIKVDTHSDNYIMQKSILKANYKKTAVVEMYPGSFRNVFEKEI